MTCRSFVSHTHTHTDLPASSLNTPKPKWSLSCLQPYIWFGRNLNVSLLSWLIFMTFPPRLLSSRSRPLYHSARIHRYSWTQNHYNRRWFFLLTHIWGKCKVLKATETLLAFVFMFAEASKPRELPQRPNNRQNSKPIIHLWSFLCCCQSWCFTYVTSAEMLNHSGLLHSSSSSTLLQASFGERGLLSRD